VKILNSRASRSLSIGVLTCLLAWASLAHGEAPSPLARVRSAGLDTLVVGRVTAHFAPADRSRATSLATLLDAAGGYFEKEFGGGLPVHLAVLRPDAWFSPYEPDSVALYGLPWGWVPESLAAVPASLEEGILIQGPDEQANQRRVRFVMLHEYGHLAAKRYLHPEGEQLWSSVRWFEEMIASYFAYTFVHQSDPDWTRAGRGEWEVHVQRDPPRSATLDWRFMMELPPREFGRTYAWYQNLLNVRVAALYDEQGLAFLQGARDQLPWKRCNTWTTDALLSELEPFAPGFQAWAEQLEQGQYLGRAVR